GGFNWRREVRRRARISRWTFARGRAASNDGWRARLDVPEVDRVAGTAGADEQVSGGAAAFDESGFSGAGATPIAAHPQRPTSGRARGAGRRGQHAEVGRGESARRHGIPGDAPRRGPGRGVEANLPARIWRYQLIVSALGLFLRAECVQGKSETRLVAIRGVL